MPWKNGGGETREIAISPEDAELAVFDWRVSTAWVAADGPFSTFPGVDRTLTVLEGAGLQLKVGEAVAVDLTPGSPPWTFPADMATAARLLQGPVLDLNVMTRRAVYRHSVERIATSGRMEVQVAAHTALLVCCFGSIHVDAGRGSAELTPLDTLRMDWPPPVSLTLAADGASQACLIRLIRQPSSHLPPSKTSLSPSSRSSR